MTVKPYTRRNAGIALLLIGSLLFLSEPMILDVHKTPDWLTPLALLHIALGLILIINFLSIRQTWKTRCTEWRRAEALTPNVTRHRWGWKEQIKNNLMDDFYPGDREFTVRGSWRIHPSNGNAVILYNPHEKTNNQWVLQHVVCTPLGRSKLIQEDIFPADELNFPQAEQMLEEWAEKFVFGDETANGLRFL